MVLVREWGRIGLPGTVRVDCFGAECDAVAAGEKLVEAKRLTGDSSWRSSGSASGRATTCWPGLTECMGWRRPDGVILELNSLEIGLGTLPAH